MQKIERKSGLNLIIKQGKEKFTCKSHVTIHEGVASCDTLDGRVYVAGNYVIVEEKE